MTIEEELQHLRTRIDELSARQRIISAAEQFPNTEIRSGDFVRFEDGHAARVSISDQCEGKWTYQDRHGRYIEPFRVPPEDGIERLYTREEVEQLLAARKS